MIQAHLRISYESTLSFTKELGFLLRSGVSLYRALQIIRQQGKDILLNSLLDDFLQEIAEGSSFSACIAKYPKVFSRFYKQMIVVGESRGELESALERIEQYLEKQKEMREKIVNALTYPAILLVLGLLVLAGMLIFVFPRFAEIFVSAGVALPLPTRVLIGLQKFLARFFPYILILLAAMVCGYFMLLRRKKFRFFIHAQYLRCPVLGNLVLAVELARFTRTLGTLYASGVQLLEALALSKAVLGNAALRQEMDRVIISVRDGKGMSRLLAKSVLFPPLLTQMLAVGEESGSLDKVLMNCAEYYTQETEYLLKRYLALLEPAALVLIAAFVMLIAASIMLPLFRMSSTLRVI